MNKRIAEILPGFFAWLTLLLLTFLSWKLPFYVAIFIILFDLYWVLKIFYLYSFLFYSFKKLKENLKINWFLKLKEEFKNSWQDIYHIIILPVFNEPFEIIDRSFNNLKSANYDKNKLIVVLAIEERAIKTDYEVALKIKEKYEKYFLKFLITIHPQNLENELPGKGSNETFALKETKKIIDDLKIPYQNILVSSFDIDSQVERDYFALLTYQYLSLEDKNVSFQPIPLFINNFYQVSPFARIIGFTSSFWQFMQQARFYRMVTFSSHSIPFLNLVEVNYWPVDVVSEDSQIFFKLLNHYNGHWRVQPLYYPIYMDAVVGSNFLNELINLYKQQRRWAWGVENWVYVATVIIKNKKIDLKKRLFWLWHTFNGFYSWAVSSLVIFLFGFMPNILGSVEFKETILSYQLPQVTGLLMNISLIGIFISAYLSVILLSPKLKDFPKKYYFFYFVQWLLLPLTFIIFSSLPALEALTRMMLGGNFRLGFWRTPKK